MTDKKVADEAVPRMAGVAGLWTVGDLVRLARLLSDSCMTLGQLLDEMHEAALDHVTGRAVEAVGEQAPDPDAANDFRRENPRETR